MEEININKLVQKEKIKRKLYNKIYEFNTIKKELVIITNLGNFYLFNIN